MSKYIFNNDAEILEFLEQLGRKERKFDIDLKTDN